MPDIAVALGNMLAVPSKKNVSGLRSISSPMRLIRDARPHRAIHFLVVRSGFGVFLDEIGHGVCFLFVLRQENFYNHPIGTST